MARELEPLTEHLDLETADIASGIREIALLLADISNRICGTLRTAVANRRKTCGD